MVKLQPWRAIKTLFGYSSSGQQKSIVTPRTLRGLALNMYSYGKDPLSTWYARKIHLTQDRLQAYKEFDDMDSCFVPSTLVDLVVGTKATIKDLADQGSVWVYSYDHATGRIVPGLGRAKKTRPNAELVEVVLDNGEAVRCTPDHRWMLRDGSYRQAKDLKAGDSLMSAKLEDSCKVVSVTALTEREDCYDLDVEIYHNFALSAGVFVHNSDIITSALDLYAEDALPPCPITGHRIWVEAEDEEVEKICNDMLARINADEQAFSIGRELAKYGNSFSGIIQEERSDGTPGGIIQLIPAPIYALSRIEDQEGRLIGFAVAPIEQMGSVVGLAQPTDLTQGNPTDPPWSFVHWRLLGKERLESYGTSLLWGARQPWRRLAMCLAGDVKISLVDGREVEIKTLLNEYGTDKPFWVYSYDVEKQRVVAKRAKHNGITRKNAQLVEVTLDNGKSVKCTPDHRMMMRDGTFRQAKDLKVGDSLMPLYRRVDEFGYETFRDPKLNGKMSGPVWAHKRFVQGDKLEVIHHVNCNKRDNRPDNLTWMLQEDHLKLHHEKMIEHWADPVFRARQIKAVGDAQRRPEVRAKQSASVKESWADPVVRRHRVEGLNREIEKNRNQALEHWQDPKYREKVVAIQRQVALKHWANPSDKRVTHPARLSEQVSNLRTNEKTRDKMFEGIRKVHLKWHHDPVVRERALQRAVETFLRKFNESNLELTRENIILFRKQTNGSHSGFPSWKQIIDRAPAVACNHKVVSVKWLEQREDTYDIDVEDTHNFALDIGVFCHNSEDALLLYRLRRSPDRFVFSLQGMTGLSPEDRARAMRQIRQELRKKHIIDQQTGQVRSELEPLGPDEDIIVDAESVKVDRLTGSVQVNHVFDIEYLRKRFFGALKIPADYMGFTEAKSGFISESPLSYQDINFARVTKRLQYSTLQGFALLCQINLCWCGIDPRSEKAKFIVHGNPVSLLDEKNRLELEKVRAETLDVLQKIGSDLGLEGEDWQAYLLQRSQIPIHLLRKTGKEKSSILKGKIVVQESTVRKVEEALKVKSNIAEKVSKIIEGRHTVMQYIARRLDEGQFGLDQAPEQLTLKELFGVDRGNVCSSATLLQYLDTNHMPLRVVGKDKKLTESVAVTQWDSVENKEAIKKTKNLMVETIQKLKETNKENVNSANREEKFEELRLKYNIPDEELVEFEEDEDEKDTN